MLLQLETVQGTEGGLTGQGLGMHRNQALTLKTVHLLWRDHEGGSRDGGNGSR